MNVLREAAKNLPGHWHRKGYSDGNGNFCAAGHIMNAAGIPYQEMVPAPTGDDDPGAEKRLALGMAFVIVNRVVREQTNGRHGFVASFNDDPNTTEEDVVAVLEKAAVRFDEEI